MAVCHFKINEYIIRTIIKKEKETHEAIAATIPTGMKTFYFLENTFYLILRIQFLCGYSIAIENTYLYIKKRTYLWILIIIPEKVKPLYDNLKQNEVE